MATILGILGCGVLTFSTVPAMAFGFELATKVVELVKKK